MNRKAGSAGIKRLFPLCSTPPLPLTATARERPGEWGGRAARKAKSSDTKGPKVYSSENVVCCLSVHECT